MHDLLFEIGTEELPASFLKPALKQLHDNFIKKAADLKISHGLVKVMGTPRRLAVRTGKQRDLWSHRRMPRGLKLSEEDI